MEVEFRGGAVYRYTGPKVADHYKALKNAHSKGGYVAASLRTCRETRCEKVYDPKAAK